MQKFLFTLLFLLPFHFAILAQMNLKKIQRSFSKVRKGLYAGKFEISNGDYLFFVNDIRRSGQKELLKLIEVDSMKWDLPYYYSLRFQEHYHDHPVYQYYPVVNVSHQAASIYCDWLTKNYNESKGRKYKKVKFRLPTQSEWEWAASGGDSTAIFPWKSTLIFDEKGMYQCNVREVAFDSFEFGKVWYDIDVIKPIKSYSSNAFGLYNTSGNVAEMLDDSSHVKGGSWFDFSNDHEISTSKTYDGEPNPTVGFRVFMEVIEK